MRAPHPHAAAPWALALGLGCASPQPGSAGALRSEPLRLADQLAATPFQRLAWPEPAAPVELDRRPLPAFDSRCQDRRYPKLAGSWLVGCRHQGLVDQAWHLSDGRRVQLDGPAISPASAPGVLYALGSDHGLWRLPQPSAVHAQPWAGQRPVAPVASDGSHGALLLERRVAAFALDERRQLLHDADPLPWFPPALDWPLVAWVDGRERATTGMDIWAWDAETNDSFPVVADPGDQRHVAASGGWLGWLDERGVWVQDLQGSRRLHAPADTGFRAGLSLWQAVACWEDRSGGDSDVICSDGLQLTGPGDQGWPSRWGPWLLYRLDGEPWLATARWLVLDDDDPRATALGPRLPGGYGGSHVEGTIHYRLDWPAQGWCVQHWRDGGWRAAGAMPTGLVSIPAPGDAIRLLPRAATRCALESA